MRSTDQHRNRRRPLRTPVRATLFAALATLTALGVVAALTLPHMPASVAQAAGAIDTATGAPAVVPPRTLVPPPPLPDRVIPEPPLPVPATEEPEPESAPVVYSCEPAADAEFGDSDNPNVITNKSCPEINAAKEQAQREFLEQLESESVGDHRESTCSDPASTDYGTAACGTDADGDGLMDGGPLDTN